MSEISVCAGINQGLFVREGGEEGEDSEYSVYTTENDKKIVNVVCTQQKMQPAYIIYTSLINFQWCRCIQKVQKTRSKTVEGCRDVSAKTTEMKSIWKVLNPHPFFNGNQLQNMCMNQVRVT